MRFAISLLVVALGACGASSRPASVDYRGAIYAALGTTTIVGLDHARTRMPLRGAHRNVACAGCHPTAGFTTELVDPRRCEACHQSPHVDRPFGKVACAACHDESSFRTASTFDHDEHTRFSLGISHHKLACASCHTPALGTNLPSTTCETCHAARTPHKDRFKAFGTPARCGLCHTASARFDPRTPTVLAPWRPNNFNHAKQTGWALSFMHGKVTCRQCHRGTAPDEFERLPKGADCMGCHAHQTVHADDTHPKGRFTNRQCLQCHVSPGSRSF